MTSVPALQNRRTVDSYSESALCAELEQLYAENLSVVPLVGAGISAQAGVPFGEDLRLYASYCVIKSLGLDYLDNGIQPTKMVFWHPAKDGWPIREGNWVDRALEGCARLRAVFELAVPNDPPSDAINLYLSLCSEARGAIEDWRTALQFLARLVMVPSSSRLTTAPNPPKNGRYVHVRASAEAREFFKDFYAQLPIVIRGLAENSIPDGQLPIFLKDSLEAIKACKRFQPESDFSKHLSNLVDGTEMRTGHVERLSKLANALNFLANLERGPWQNQCVVLADVKSEVVDAFFANLVSKTRPCMAHHMLVHMSSLWASNVVLTLNFDDLIERAFRIHKHEPTVLEVHEAGALPPWGLCTSGFNVVKLHGGKQGLRAGYNLDAEPSTEDKRNFLTYFTKTHQLHSNNDTPVGTHGPNGCKAHLLVMGISGRDARVRGLIRHALASIPNLKVFWLCHTDDDEKLIGRYFQPSQALNEEPVGTIYTIHSQRPAFLLLDAFQRMRGTMPVGGIDLPVTWKTPVPAPFGDLQEQNAILKSNENKESIGNVENWEKTGPEPVLLLKPKGQPSQTCGIATIAWHFYTHWSGKHNCVWIDIQSMKNEEGMLRRLLEGIRAHLDQLPTKPGVSGTVTVEEAVGILQRTQRPWVLFINLRGSPGYDADPFRKLIQAQEPDASDNFEMALSERRLRWEGDWLERADASNLSHFLSRVATELNSGRALPRIRIVICCGEKIELELGNTLAVRSAEFGVLPSELSDERRVRNALQWAAKALYRDEVNTIAVQDFNCRLRLLRLLTLLRTSRHHLALDCAEVFGSEMAENDRREAVTRAVKDLSASEVRLIRLQSGGFIWMHWRVRERLRFCLNHPGSVDWSLLFKETRTNVVERQMHFEGPKRVPTGHLHSRVAQWQTEMFRASQDPLAAFEVVYHHCRAAKNHFENREFSSFRASLCHAKEHMDAAHSPVLLRSHQSDALDVYSKLIQFLCDSYKACKVLFDGSDVKHDMRLEMQRNMRTLMVLKPALALQAILLARDCGDLSTLESLCDQLKDWVLEWQKMELSGSCESNEEIPISAILSTLELAIAKVSRRNYHNAELKLRELYAQLTGWNVTDWEGKMSQLPSAMWQCIVEMGVRPDLGIHRFTRRRLAIRVLRRLIEVKLLQAEVASRLHELGIVNGDVRARTHLQWALLYWSAALKVREAVIDDKSHNLSLEEHRMHSVMAGVCALRCSVYLEKFRFYDAIRHLQQAEALEAGLLDTEHLQGQIVTNLRRVFCIIEQIRANAHYRLHRALVWDSAEGQSATYDAGEVAKLLERRLNEMEALIETCKRLFAEGRKTLWWWNTLLRYEMVTFEYRQLMRLARIIAHKVGQSEDTQNTVLDADRIDLVMKDATVRCQTDGYQLARIAISYLTFVRARAKVARLGRGGLAKHVKSLVETPVPTDVTKILQHTRNVLLEARKNQVAYWDGDVRAYVDEVVGLIEQAAENANELQTEL